MRLCRVPMRTSVHGPLGVEAGSWAYSSSTRPSVEGEGSGGIGGAPGPNRASSAEAEVSDGVRVAASTVAVTAETHQDAFRMVRPYCGGWLESQEAGWPVGVPTARKK